MSDTNSFMNIVTNIGCGCAGCASGSGIIGNTDYYYNNSDIPYYDDQSATATTHNYSGTVYTNGTLENAVDSLFGGSKWANATLTFSFPNSTTDYGSNYYNTAALSGFAAMNANQKEAIRYIYDMVEKFSGLTFTELTGAS